MDEDAPQEQDGCGDPVAVSGESASGEQVSLPMEGEPQLGHSSTEADIEEDTTDSG